MDSTLKHVLWLMPVIQKDPCSLALQAALEYAIYGTTIWLLAAPTLMGYMVWLAQRFQQGHGLQGTIIRECLMTMAVVALSLPLVLAVCACFLAIQEPNMSLKPLHRAAIFSALMVVLCVSKVIASKTCQLIREKRTLVS